MTSPTTPLRNLAQSAITITTDDGEMPAHLWLPPRRTGPGIVVLQEIFGVTNYIQRRAAQLSGLGYVVLAPEIYWRLGSTEPIAGDDALERGMGMVQRLDWKAAVRDGVSAVRALRRRDEVTNAVGVVGFCFGGGLGFSVAAHLEEQGESLDALVSYYGSSLPRTHDTLTVAGPSLHHFGLADSFVATDAVKAIEASLTRHPATTFHTYAGADHAFDNDETSWHHAEASRLAWQRTLAFLGQHLRSA